MKVNVTSVMVGLICLALAAGAIWISVAGLPTTRILGLAGAAALVAVGAVGLLLATRNPTD